MTALERARNNRVNALAALNARRTCQHEGAKLILLNDLRRPLLHAIPAQRIAVSPGHLRIAA